jgi:hypothetical protein
MTPQNQQPQLGQEAAVAVLQTTTQHLETRVGELVKSTNDGMAAIATKLDEISKQSAILAQLAAEQANHSKGLERAFGELRAVEVAGKSEVARLEQKIDHNTTSITEIKGQAQFAKGGLYVLGAVGVLVLGVLIWALNPTLQQAGKNAEEIKEIQLNEMKYHPTP